MSARNTLTAKAARRAERQRSAARFSSCANCRTRVPAGEWACDRYCARVIRRTVGWHLAAGLVAMVRAWLGGASAKAQVAPMGNHPTPVEIGAPGQSRGLVRA